MIRLRPARLSTDKAGIASVVNAFELNPVSEDTVHEWLTHTVPDRISYRQVAVTKEDTVVGYAVSVHETWDPPGQFYAWAGVSPAWRGQDVGSALYSDMLRFLDHHRAGTITSEVLDNCPVSQAFAKREDSKTTGPGLSFEEFNEWVYEAGWCRPDGQLLAADGNHWVGICAVRLYSEVEQAFNVHTGVVRDYRRRHIALALKLTEIRYTRDHAARSLSTNNDSTNEPMLALN